MKKNISIISYTVLIILINLIFFNFNIRFDLTKNKIYSLSKGTKNILKNIEDNMFIDLYYSKELPLQISSNKDYSLSILKDYSSYSGGRIKFSSIIVDNSKDSQKSAIEEGITPVRFDIVSKEKFEQREGFLGLVMRYRDKKEIIPFISDISNFEYDISSRINNLTVENKKAIYFITDSQALSSYRISAEIREKLSSYELKDATISELYSSTSDITAFFIGPSSPLDEKSVFYIDQILTRGAKLFIAYDARYTSLDTFFTRDNRIGIEKIFEKNGIKVKNTLIIDKNSQAIQIASRMGPFVVTNIVKYPYFVISDNLDRTNPTTRDIYSLTLPFISPIDYSTSTNICITPLIKTSEYSFARKENSYININPFQDYIKQNDDIKGPFVVSVLAKGKFSSSFDKPLDKTKEKEFIKEGNRDSLLYLITTSKFLFQENLNPDNVQYFINIAGFLLQNEDLISIKPKKAGFIPLKEINDNLKIAIKYANIFIPIIIVIGFGVYRWKKMEINRKIAKEKYIKA